MFCLTAAEPLPRVLRASDEYVLQWTPPARAVLHPYLVVPVQLRIGVSHAPLMPRAQKQIGEHHAPYDEDRRPRKPQQAQKEHDDGHRADYCRRPYIFAGTLTAKTVGTLPAKDHLGAK